MGAREAAGLPMAGGQTGRRGTLPAPVQASCPRAGLHRGACPKVGQPRQGGAGVPWGGRQVCTEGPSCAQHMSPGGPGALATGARLGAAGHRQSADKGCFEQTARLLRALRPADCPGNAEGSSLCGLSGPFWRYNSWAGPEARRPGSVLEGPHPPAPLWGHLLAPGWPPGFPGLWGEKGKTLTLVTHAPALVGGLVWSP